MNYNIPYTNQSKQLFDSWKEITLNKNIKTDEKNLKECCQLCDVDYLEIYKK